MDEKRKRIETMTRAILSGEKSRFGVKNAYEKGVLVAQSTRSDYVNESFISKFSRESNKAMSGLWNLFTGVVLTYIAYAVYSENSTHSGDSEHSLINPSSSDKDTSPGTIFYVFNFRIVTVQTLSFSQTEKELERCFQTGSLLRNCGV